MLYLSGFELYSRWVPLNIIVVFVSSDVKIARFFLVFTAGAVNSRTSLLPSTGNATNIAQFLKMEFGKRVTVVEYDLTSGSDNDDRDDDQSYIYCSIARPLSPGNRFRHDGDAQQPGERSSDSDDCPPEIKRARIDDSCRSSTQSSESSCESASSCSDQEESDHSEPMPAPTPKLPPPVVISIPSDDDGQEDEGEPEQPLVAPLPKQRAAYALRLTDLPPNLERFMKETKSFFTRSHSLERHGQKLATSTFEKTEERVLCEYRSFHTIYCSCIARYISSHWQRKTKENKTKRKENEDTESSLGDRKTGQFLKSRDQRNSAQVTRN